MSGYFDFIWNYFSPTFNKNEAKIALKTAGIRMKLHKNKRIENIGKEKQNIRNLMLEGKDESARIRVEYVIRDENLVQVYEILEIFCEKLQSRLDLIEISDVCPNDIREAVDTLIYCAPLVEIQELQKAKYQFALRWGTKDPSFIPSIEQGKSEFINTEIKARLAIKAPEPSVILQKLGEITGVSQQVPSVPFLETHHHFPPPNYGGNNGGFPANGQYSGGPSTTYSTSSSSYGNSVPQQMNFPSTSLNNPNFNQFPQAPGPQYQHQFPQQQFQQQPFQPSNKNSFSFPEPPRESSNNQSSNSNFVTPPFPQPPSPFMTPKSSENNNMNSSSSHLFPSPPSNNSSTPPPNVNVKNEPPNNGENEFMDLDELSARFEVLKNKTN